MFCEAGGTLATVDVVGARRRMLSRRSAAKLIGGAALLGAPQLVRAQAYPTRPITLLVGLSAGGLTDVMARLYAAKVSRILGQTIVVENRPAGSGAIAAAGVQKAMPDGYTLLIFSGAQHAIIPATTERAPYDPVKGLQPVGIIFNYSAMLAVPADSPAHSIADLVALSKNKPGGLNFGSPGIGTPSHLVAAKLVLATGMKVQFVHYKGGAPVMADLVSGRLDAGWPSSPVARPFLVAKTIRALALDGVKRWRLIPDVPTVAEAGYPDVAVANWFAIGAAPGTPAPVIAKLNAAFAEAGRDPELIARVEDLGMQVATSSPEQLGRLMVKEAADIRELAVKLGLNQ